MPPTLRSAKPSDVPFLREMLYLAIWVPRGVARMDRSILDEPSIAHYVDGFGEKPTDAGFIAEISGKQIGACWSRILSGEPKGYGNIDDETPELAIAMNPECRGQGYGSLLLETLLEELDQTHPKTSISVAPDNPARRLYVRAGFEKVGEFGDSDTMARTRR